MSSESCPDPVGCEQVGCVDECDGLPAWPTVDAGWRRAREWIARQGSTARGGSLAEPVCCPVPMRIINGLLTPNQTDFINVEQALMALETWVRNHDVRCGPGGGQR